MSEEKKKKNRRKEQRRNLYSFPAFDRRRKKQPNGGYPDSSICPNCGRPIVKNGEPCRDCEREEVINWGTEEEVGLSVGKKSGIISIVVLKIKKIF